MTKVGDWFVYICQKFNNIPVGLMCAVLFLVQAGTLNYYLVYNISDIYLCWLLADAVNLVVLIVTIVYSSYTLRQQRNNANFHSSFHSISWIAWFLINASVSVKVILVLENDAIEIEAAATFFGPNTFKTTVAMGSCIFLFLLNTQHDAPVGSDRRAYIDAMTNTVVFDILDTVDILEVCLSEGDRESLWSGLKKMILAQASLNLLLPTVPLLTLSRTQFGRDKLTRSMIYLHRLLVVLVFNVPNLITRLVLWHGLSMGISPFALKNVVLIGMTLLEFYEHKLQKYWEHEKERHEMQVMGQSSCSERRFSKNAIDTDVEPRHDQHRHASRKNSVYSENSNEAEVEAVGGHNPYRRLSRIESTETIVTRIADDDVSDTAALEEQNKADNLVLREQSTSSV